MPRLTDPNYLRIRSWLKQLWDDDFKHGWFVYQSPTEQWGLHAFFQITKDLSDSELTRHRAVMSKLRLSLPHQAGKAVAHLDRLIQYGPLQDPAYQRQQAQARRAAITISNATGKKPRTLIVGSEVRPDIDVKKVARAIILVTRQDQPESDDSA